MGKTLELAIAKAAALSEPAQERLGREMLERIDALSRLREAIEIGQQELDAGLGKPLDIEQVIAQAHREHVGR